MTTETIETVLGTDRERAFAYLSDIRNLPDWAVEFCHRLETKDGLDGAVNDRGRAYVRFETDHPTGLIDMAAGPAKDQMITWPSRVFGLPDGRTVFLITAIQLHGMEGQVFRSQLQSLSRELSVLAEELR